MRNSERWPARTPFVTASPAGRTRSAHPGRVFTDSGPEHAAHRVNASATSEFVRNSERWPPTQPAMAAFAAPSACLRPAAGFTVPAKISWKIGSNSSNALP